MVSCVLGLMVESLIFRLCILEQVEGQQWVFVVSLVLDSWMFSVVSVVFVECAVFLLIVEQDSKSVVSEGSCCSCSAEQSDVICCFFDVCGLDGGETSKC